MAYTERYVSALAETGIGDGSIGNPWTFAEAVAAATNGMRINVKNDGVYQIIGSAEAYEWVTAARCGTPALPIMWRGYTTTIGDGGKPRLINTGNVKYMKLTGDINSRYNCIIRDMDINFEGGTTSGVITANYGIVFINCRIAQTKLTGAGAHTCVSGTGCAFIGCLFKSAHSGYATATCLQSIDGFYCGCTFLCAAALTWSLGTNVSFIRNVCVCTDPSNTRAINYANPITDDGGALPAPSLFAHNVFNGFNNGLVFAGAGAPNGFWLNNIFSNATNGVVLSADLKDNTDHALLFLGNRYYNVTNPFSAYLDELDVLMSPWLGMAEIATDPFVDAANGDYRVVSASGLIDTAKPMYDYAGLPFGIDVGAYDVVPVEDYPAPEDVRHDVDYKNGIYTGTCHVPPVSDVRAGVPVEATVGTCAVPAAADVRVDVPTDDTVGTCAVPPAADVRTDVPTDDTVGACAVPQAADVRLDVAVDDTTGTCAVPAPEDVKVTVPVDDTVGTFDATRDLIFKDESSVG